MKEVCIILVSWIVAVNLSAEELEVKYPDKALVEEVGYDLGYVK